MALSLSSRTLAPTLLLIAFVLLFITSISLPFLPALDFTRVHTNGINFSESNNNALREVRFGIWAPCIYSAKNGDQTCPHLGHGYIFGFISPVNGKIAIIGASWTRGLAIHPVAAIVTLAGLIFSLPRFQFSQLIAPITTLVAAFITLIAFAVDIALLAFVRHQVGELGIPKGGISTNTGAGFWLTFVSLILLIIAAIALFFGRERGSVGYSKSNFSSEGFALPSLLSRFRR